MAEKEREQNLLEGQKQLDIPDENAQELARTHEEAELPPPREINKKTIEATVKQCFGTDAECTWGTATSKKRKTLAIRFTILGAKAGFEIRDAKDLVEVARVVVAIYGRVRATIIGEMAAGVAMSQDRENRLRVENEKRRMAGLDPVENLAELDAKAG